MINEISILFISIIILFLNQNVIIYPLLFVLYDILRNSNNIINSLDFNKFDYINDINKKDKDNNKDNDKDNNKDNDKDNNKDEFRLFKYLFFGGFIIVSIDCISRLYFINYLPKLKLNSKLYLFIFLIITFIYLIIGPDSYFYDYLWFKNYYYKSRQNIIEKKLVDIQNMDSKKLLLFKDSELFRIFEKQLHIHELLNNQFLIFHGRISQLIITSFAILIFSPFWLLKILISSYILQKFLIFELIKDFGIKRQKINNKQNDIVNELAYIFSDLTNYISNIYGSLHAQKIKELSKEDNKLDFKVKTNERLPGFIIRIWTFFLYFGIIIYIYILINKKKIEFSDIIKIIIGTLNVGYIGKNIASIYQSILEIWLNIEKYQSFNNILFKEINYDFINKSNVYIKLDEINNSIYLFNKKLKNRLTYIKGKNGSGKSSILNALYYNNNYMINNSSYFTQNNIIDIKGKTPFEVITGLYKIKKEEFVIKCLNIVSNKLEINKKIINLSGGEKQRILIAKSLYQVMIYNYRFLLLDEPDNHIDTISFTNIIKNILHNIDDIKIILTTHKPKSLNNINKYTIDLESVSK